MANVSVRMLKMESDRDPTHTHLSKKRWYMVHETTMSRTDIISGMVGPRNSKVGHWILDFSSIFWFFALVGSIFRQLPHVVAQSICGLISPQLQVHQREREMPLPIVVATVQV